MNCQMACQSHRRSPIQVLKLGQTWVNFVKLRTSIIVAYAVVNSRPGPNPVAVKACYEKRQEDEPTVDKSKLN